MVNQTSKKKGPEVSSAATAVQTRVSRVDSRAVQAESPLYRYMQRKYREHHRRVVSWRKAARWALFFYPIVTAIVLAVPFVAVKILFRHLYNTQPEWFTGVLPPESSSFVLPLCSTLSGAALFGGFLLGVAFGIARSRALCFEAERVELKVRQSFYLGKLARKHKKAKLA